MLIGAADATASASSFEIGVQAGSRRLRVGWDPSTENR